VYNCEIWCGTHVPFMLFGGRAVVGRTGRYFMNATSARLLNLQSSGNFLRKTFRDILERQAWSVCIVMFSGLFENLKAYLSPCCLFAIILISRGFRLSFLFLESPRTRSTGSMQEHFVSSLQHLKQNVLQIRPRVCFIATGFRTGISRLTNPMCPGHVSKDCLHVAHGTFLKAPIRVS